MKTKSVKKTKVATAEKPAVIQSAPITPNALSAKAINLRLSTSAFVGNPRDKAITQEVNKTYNITSGRGSFRKKIMQGPEINKVAASLQQVRKQFERLSAPWLDGGIRILPARRFIETKLTLEKEIRVFNKAVDDFIAAYPVILNRDQQPEPVGLGKAFNIADYPSPEELRGKFGARLEAFPIPTDFRVEGIDDSTREQMQSELEKLASERIKEAKRDIISRLLEKVRHLSARLCATGETERFSKTAIANVAEICDDVCAIVFDDDAEVIRIAGEVKAALANLSADAIRDSEPARKEACEKVSAELEKVQNLMAGFMG